MIMKGFFCLLTYKYGVTISETNPLKLIEAISFAGPGRPACNADYTRRINAVFT